MKYIVIKLIIAVILFTGEIKCIVKFFKCDFEPSYKAECIYGISIVTGIGSVIGYIDFGK